MKITAANNRRRKELKQNRSSLLQAISCMQSAPRPRRASCLPLYLRSTFSIAFSRSIRSVLHRQDFKITSVMRFLFAKVEK